jgi:uncharacterized membrane protein YecN with MAPEG domain
VRDKLNTYAGKQTQLLSVAMCCKLVWYGHVTRYDSLSKTILQGTVNGYQTTNFWLVIVVTPRIWPAVDILSTD